MLLHLLNRSFHPFQQTEEFAQEKLMMRGGSPVNASTSWACLCATLLWTNEANRSGSRSPPHSACKIARASDPHDIGGHTGEFDPCLLQHFEHPIDQLRAILYQMHAQPRQVPQVLLGSIGHKARGEQPMLEQISQPVCVLHIGLVTRHEALICAALTSTKSK